MAYHFRPSMKGLAEHQPRKWPSLVLTLIVKYLQTTKEEHRFLKKIGQTLAHFSDPLGGWYLGKQGRRKAQVFEKIKMLKCI